MKYTSALVKHLTDKLGLDKKHLDDSTRQESEIQSFLMEKLMAGEIEQSTVVALNKSEASSAAEKMISDAVSKAVSSQNAQIDALTKSVASLTDLIGKGLKIGTDGATATGTDLGKAGAVLTAEVDQKGAGEARVKKVSEQFDHTRKSLTYADSDKAMNRKWLGNNPLELKGTEGSRVLEKASEWDKAVAGSWLKWMVARSCKLEGKSVPQYMRMTELDKKIVEEAVNECKFIGPVGAHNEESDQAIYHCKSEKLNDFCKKNLLDESGASQGLEAVPIEFDAVAITTPLLNGELLPLVNFTTVSRRRIEGFSIGNPTFAHTAEGTNITYFNTDAFIAAFDTTIYPVTSAIRVGLDFASDSPVDIAGLIAERFQEAFGNHMDNLIASGGGTTSMLGLTATSGLVAVSSANGTGGAPTVSDYEGLLFAVRKEWRQQAGMARSVYLANETTYRRARSIAVGASDQRRVFGMEHEDYMLLGHPFKINHGLANTRAGFFCMNRYRAYRRAGYSVRVVTEDQDLALSNRQAIIVRSRVGGQLDRGAAGALITDMQS